MKQLYRLRNIFVASMILLSLMLLNQSCQKDYVSKSSDESAITKVSKSLVIPTSKVKPSSGHSASKVPPEEEGGGELPPSFTARVTLYSNGYATVTLDATVKYASDYTIRATVFNIRTVGGLVKWDINYVYSRNGVTFYSTEAEYSAYP